MSEHIEPKDLTARDVERWLEQVATLGELVHFVGYAYAQLLFRIVDAKASADELNGLWRKVRRGWRVRFFHAPAQGQVTSELAREGEVDPVFEYQAPHLDGRREGGPNR